MYFIVSASCRYICMLLFMRVLVVFGLGLVTVYAYVAFCLWSYVNIIVASAL